MSTSIEIDVPLKTIVMAIGELPPKHRAGCFVDRVDADVVITFPDGYAGPPEEDIRARALQLGPEVEQMVARSRIRETIADKADDKSLLGVTSDAASYALDDMAMDILAVAGSAESSYKAKRISLYNELHGDDAWDDTVLLAQQWFDQRKTGAIKLPIDAKGAETVFADVAFKGGIVASAIQDATQ